MHTCIPDVGMSFMTDYIGHQFGNYRVLRPLGKGHFATVYLAEHLYLDTLAAIKVLHVQMEPESYNVFLSEARIIAGLQHSHIIRIIDFGIQDQTPYLVIEYAPNGTLNSLHPKGSLVPEEKIISYVQQIASALDYAHEQRVIHRDIKPENILLNAKHEIVLSDFGIAVVQHTLDSRSAHGQAGTPLYMAPEQIRGRPCPASDQYALAVIVYQWLCGEPPFTGPGMAVFNQHLHEPPPSLCARVPLLPAGVQETVFGALAKDPLQRFVSVTDFATVLGEAMQSTQPLWLSGSREHHPQDESASLPARAPSIVPSEQDATNETTQPSLTSSQREYEQPPEFTPPMMMASSQPSAISIVSVCAPSDVAYLRQWETHLRPLERAGRSTVWSELHLLAGATRARQINERLAQANITVLLLSADFFASDDCIALMNRALLRHRHDEARLIPLLLRPAAWQESSLASLSCLPFNQIPVTEWPHQDAAFDECVQEIRRILDQLSTKHSQTPGPVIHNQDRVWLLRRVRSFWITGVLEQSSPWTGSIALGLQERFDAVANPWQSVLHVPEVAPRLLPAGTRVTQVYDKAEGELLILGAPGSGKTMLLLELARDLLDRAGRDDRHPLPVIFNLSSWAIKRQPLMDWLIEELNSKYQVPRKRARAMVQASQILPLLDGLDEVAPQGRTSCTEVINEYRKEHGFVPFVVCSRSADYLALTTRLILRRAVIIQPLTDQQVNNYLAQAGEPLQALRVALHKDPSLRELTHIPLMLNVLAMTYYNVPAIDALHAASSGGRIREVFEHYVKRMLVHGDHYPFQDAKQWLSWLAKQLKQRNQTVFYIERMQPDWLEAQPGAGRSYHRIVVGLIFGLLGFLVLGPLWGGTTWFVLEFLSATVKSFDPIPVFALALLFTFVGASILGLINSLFYKQYEGSSTQKQRRWVKVRQWIARNLLNGLLVGLLFGVPSGFITGYAAHDPLTGMLTVGPLMSILGVIMFGLLDGLLTLQTITIQPAEIVAWSWSNMWRYLVKFLCYGLLSALLLGLLIGILLEILSGTFVTALFWSNLYENLWFVLRIGSTSVPFFALFGALLGGLRGGLSSDVLDKRDIVVPNQGIRRSARHSLLVGIISVLVVVVITVLLVILFGGVSLPFMFFIGPLVVLVSALRAGGIACIQHFVLRWLLWRDKKMPWNYPRFLDYAAKRILLRKVGGGYMFVHRLLLEYFASL